MDFIKKKSTMIALAVLVLLIFVYSYYNSKSGFNTVLANAPLTTEQPKNFPPIQQVDSGDISKEVKLQKPDVAEEIGFGMVYPQGDGVGMSNLDSNSFYPNNPGSLLTEYKIPESYGESSLADTTGELGASQGARILKIKNTGNPFNYKPLDESVCDVYAPAYTSSGEIQSGSDLLSEDGFINYTDDYNPNDNLMIQTSPGQESTVNNCDTTYPNVVKYNNFCITKGDIPYGQVLNGQVNPRLVSRWESYTGKYSPEEALKGIDGLLYPTLNVLS